MTEPTEPEDEAVLAQIRDAFPRVEITAEGAFDQWGTTYLDAEPYQRELTGKSWDQLDKDYVVVRSDALGFLGTRHLVAVLPVYLGAMIERGAWSDAAGMLTLILARPDRQKDDGLGATRFDELVEALTEAQRAAVAATLQRFGEKELSKYPESSLGLAARAALDSYWKEFVALD
jgi:hypothetical protein